MVTPPWVTATIAAGAAGRSSRNARKRAPASRDDEPVAGTKSRSRSVQAHSARNASIGWVPSQFIRSRNRSSSWTGKFVAVAMHRAVSVARRNGLL